MLSYTQNNHFRFSQAVKRLPCFRSLLLGNMYNRKTHCSLCFPLSPLDMPSGWFGSRVTKSFQLGVIHSMLGPFLTLQFSTQTWKETSTRGDYGLRTLPWPVHMQYAQVHTHTGTCSVYFIYFCCVGGLVAVVHSFLISVSFAPQAPWSRTIYSVPCHVTNILTCT